MGVRMKLHQKSEVNVVPCKHFQYEFDFLNESTCIFFGFLHFRNCPKRPLYFCEKNVFAMKPKLWPHKSHSW